MASNSLKILVAGSVKGQYEKFFKRVSDVNRKAGPFDLLLCVGDFFGDDIDAYKELINGSTELPNTPTYILSRIPHQQLLQFHPNIDNFDQGCELIDGVTFLGRSGILTTSLGLRIAYLNGRYRKSSADNNDDDKDLDFFSEKEYESLIMSCQSSSDIIDVLLTIEWPKHIFNHAGIDVDDSILTMIEKSNSMKISQLCNSLRPRYHFVGGLVDWFYERVPYRNHKVLIETSRNVSRFLSMANIDNVKKMKWIYAFNIVPSRYLTAQEITAQPTGVSENPYRNALQEQSEQDAFEQDHSNQFRYDLSHDHGDGDSGRRSNDKRKRHGHQQDQQQQQQNRQPKERRTNNSVDQQNCWFCLASPDVDKSLIVSIGDHSYLALAKGGLTDDHMMILPIEHIRSTVEINNDGLHEEINKFKQALTKFYQQKSMVPVFFERNFKSAHFQIQVLGLPETKTSFLREAIDEIFKPFKYFELNSNEELNEIINQNVPYFYFECPNHYKFVVRIQVKREFFPIQIGRQLMAHKLLLNCPERIDWKYCAKNSKKSAAELTRTIRDSFQPFDFTL
uniref:CWF19-like protein 1 n=1 Tax=Dermatophagoides pteronyssinus TaxID=6956 RepID=A0A6P6XZX1_DERPT|nr:CWF19-like protein 1 [Dermatophagoides pteronyssinus]